MYHNNHTGKGPTVVKHNLTNLYWRVEESKVDEEGGHFSTYITVNATAPPALDADDNGTHSLFKDNGYLSFIVSLHNQ